MPAQTTIPVKLSITIVEQNKISYDRIKFNQYLVINTLAQKYKKENCNTRKLVPSTKTQTIYDLTTSKPKIGKHTK